MNTHRYKSTHHKAQGHEWLSLIQVIQEGSSICVPVQRPAHRMLHPAWPPLLLIDCPQLQEKGKRYQQEENLIKSIQSDSFLTDNYVGFRNERVIKRVSDLQPCFSQSPRLTCLWRPSCCSYVFCVAEIK